MSVCVSCLSPSLAFLLVRGMRIGATETCEGDDLRPVGGVLINILREKGADGFGVDHLAYVS